MALWHGMYIKWIQNGDNNFRKGINSLRIAREHSSATRGRQALKVMLLGLIGWSCPSTDTYPLGVLMTDR